MGELVARVLNGEDPAAIGVQEPVASGCMADWRPLRRWGIEGRLLPAGREVRFRELTFWDRYHRPFLAVLGTILPQAALIVARLLNPRRLRQSQVTLVMEYARRTEAGALAARLRAKLERFSKERSLMRSISP